MPMNRHLTWGDRQAELAREKNLKKLQKLAAMAPAPTTENAPTTEPNASAAKPKPAQAKTKPAPAKTKAKASATKARPPAKKTTKK